LRCAVFAVFPFTAHTVGISRYRASLQIATVINTASSSLSAVTAVRCLSYLFVKLAGVEAMYFRENQLTLVNSPKCIKWGASTLELAATVEAKKRMGVRLHSSMSPRIRDFLDNVRVIN